MKEIKNYLKEMDKKTSLIGIGGMVLIILWAYYGHHSFFIRSFAGLKDNPNLNFWEFFWMNSSAFLLWFLLPVLLVKFFLKEKLKDFGLGIGDFRFGGKFLILGIAVMVIPLYLTGKNPEFIREYPLTKLAGKSPLWFLSWELSYFTYYLGFEFMFRGFMLFGLKPKFGNFGAILFQTAISTLIHIGMTAHSIDGVIVVGKPITETLSAILAGLVFGAVALRTRSMLYPLLLHWFIGASTDFFCLYHSGGLWR